MTIQYRELAAQAAADGTISAGEILALRRAGWADGVIGQEEARTLFAVNDSLKEEPADWCDFFVEAISEFLVNGLGPEGYVDEAKAKWLIERIDADGLVESMTELELIARLFEKAVAVPDSLKTYALDQIEQAVLSGEGPTRDGGMLDAGCITESEVPLLRRFIFAAGGDRPAAVSQAEAEALFRIKDAAQSGDNAPSWQQLFVQGVGNYLRGFGGSDPLPQERAAELEAFMNNNAASIGGFLSRMMHSSPKQGFDYMREGDRDARDLAAEAAEADRFDQCEQAWLQGKLDADGQLDEMEKALLAFLAEE
jgi:hypothetical protein